MLRGLGDSQGAVTGVQIGGTVAGTVVPAVLASQAASTAAATGSAAAILGMAPALAVPVIGAAIAGVAMAVTYFIKHSGCGITCVETSQWANEAEPYLRQNIDAYFKLPTPRSQSQQQAALNVFDTIFARLQQLCGQAGTGNAGVRCISDRQSGACKWNATADSPWPGGPAQGSCWNWFNAYRDPIAADSVVSDAAASVSSVSSAFSSSSSLLPLALIGGLLIAAVIL